LLLLLGDGLVENTLDAPSAALEADSDPLTDGGTSALSRIGAALAQRFQLALNRTHLRVYRLKLILQLLGSVDIFLPDDLYRTRLIQGVKFSLQLPDPLLQALDALSGGGSIYSND
jgi:hypothetical protein